MDHFFFPLVRVELRLLRKLPRFFAWGYGVGRLGAEAIYWEDEDAGAVFLIFGCAGGEDSDDGALFVEDDIRPLDAEKFLLAVVGEADGDLVGEERVF